MKSISAGCGGNINLTSSQSFKTQTGSTYDSFEDCHWIVSATEGKNIKFTINSMDVRNSINRTGNGCTGDYIEVKFHSFCPVSFTRFLFLFLSTLSRFAMEPDLSASSSEDTVETNLHLPYHRVPTHF